MAVKPKTKENRGGARPGAGRPKGAKTRTLTTKAVDDLLKTARKYTKITGKTVDDVLCESMFAQTLDGDPIRIGVRDRITVIKLFKEYTTAKPSEGGEADKQLGPTIYLPAHKQENVVSIK